MDRIYLLLTVGLFLSIQSAVGSKELIDLNPDAVFGSSDVCHHADKRISRLSTIKKLADLFEASNDASCRDLWLKPLLDLQKVLDKVQVDACSQEAVDEIHNFHWTYVVGTLSKSWRKASKAPLPEPLRVFFMNLADDIAERCMSKLSDRLAEASSSADKSVSLGFGFGFTVDTVSMALVMKDNVKKYDDFFLIFESLADGERKKGRQLPLELDPSTGELVTLSVKLNNATKPFEIQQRCRKDLRPIYVSTVLPVMKLIDMGFGNKGNKVGDNELLKQWYFTTQFCQLILPVRFYSSSSLKEGQVSLVSKEEAQTLQSPPGAVLKGELPAAKKVTPVHLDDDVLTGSANERIAKKTKANLKSRGRIYRRTFKNVLWTVKSHMKSLVKSIFISKKKGDKFVLEQNASEIENSIETASQELREEELNELEVEEKGLARSKRSIDDVHPIFHVLFAILITLVLILAICSMALN